jgi:glycosyltransferase involved in cell wall biosynthesis
MQILVPFSMKRAALVLTVSEFSKQSIVDTYHIPPERILVTYNGVSPMFRPLEGASSIPLERLERLRIHPPYILGVGNLQPRKNLEGLLRAYADLRKRRSPPHRLVLVGQSSWQGHRVGEEVARLGLADWVTLPGYLSNDDLVSLYNLADVFVYPSIYEGFGLPVIEAMACGTPVITSNVSSLPEVAANAAVFIDPESEAEISAALEQLIDDRGLRIRLREAGLARAKLFSWRRTAEQTIEAYRRCL